MPRKKPAKKTAKRIFFTREISNLHFLKRQKPTDEYFRSVADKVYEALETEGPLGLPINDEQRRSIALRMTMYLEDLVTETGTWLAFTSMCEKRYGRPIPMAENLMEMIPEEKANDDFDYNEEIKYFPQIPAIQFLLWLWVGECLRDTILNPENPGLGLMAIKLTQILQDAYNDAPDLVFGRVAFVDEKICKVPNYVQVRSQCNWLLTTNWLTRCIDYDDICEEFIDELSQIFPGIDDSENVFSYACESYLPMNTQTGPLAAYPHEWLKEMVKLVHEEEEEFILPYLENLESIPFTGYLYHSISEDRRTALIEGANGQMYDFSAYSMPDEKIQPEIKPNTMSIMSIIKWGDKWCLNSVSNSGIDRQMFDGMKTELGEKKEQQEASFKFVSKSMKGKRIGVIRNLDEVADIFKKVGIKNMPNDYNEPDDIRDANNIVWFITKSGNLTFYPDIAGCIKLRGNKFYDKEQARAEGIALVMASSAFSDEFRQYIVENNLIPDAALNNPIDPALGKQIFQDNIKFFFDLSCRDKFDMFASL